VLVRVNQKPPGVGLNAIRAERSEQEVAGKMYNVS